MRYARIIVGLAVTCLITMSACAQPDRAASKAAGPLAGRVATLKIFEQQIADAIARRDDVFLDRVTALTFTRTDQDGNVEDRASVFAQIRKPPPTSDVVRWTINPATHQVQLHGDIGISRSETEVRGPRRAFTTTAVKVYRWRSSRWQLLSHTTISITPLAP